jgi:hypothetical protein
MNNLVTLFAGLPMRGLHGDECASQRGGDQLRGNRNRPTQRSVQRHFMRLTLLPLIILVAACSDTESIDRFADTYAEILVVRSLPLDSLAARHKVDSVLNVHGYSRESFRKNFENLMHDPKSYKSVLDSARVRARRLMPEK